DPAVHPDPAPGGSGGRLLQAARGLAPLARKGPARPAAADPAPAPPPEPGGGVMSAVLEATGVSVSFGGVRALVDLDLDVGEGELVGLIGPNGAGKTTFVDAISGFVPYSGRVELDGADLAGLRPHVRALRGLARTWQSTELFDDLTVRENLAVASRRPSLWEITRELFRGEYEDGGAIDEALDL